MVNGDTMRVNTLSLFPTPVIQTRFECHDKYVNKFGNWGEIDRKPKAWHVSLNTSFPEIRPDDPYVSEEIVNNLKNDIMFQVKKVNNDRGISTNLEYQCFWYNAYYTKQGQEPHNHLSQKGEDPLWSGVYFAKNCFPGSFTFVKTEYSHRSQQWFDYQSTKMRAYYDEFYPTTFGDGDLVLFPPHLHHAVQVDERNAEDQRLTFSFNIRLIKDENDGQ